MADDGTFRGLLHLLEPDYDRPRHQLPAPIAGRLRARLERLYGEDAGAAFAELERVILVHAAHMTDEIRAAEAAFDPRERFTEADVVLITYGDLVVSDGRPPLEILAELTERLFRGVITTLHILPFHPYSSDRGFSVVSYEEVDPNLGTWEDIAELERSFRLMFDGVFNHVSTSSRRFRRFLDGDPRYQQHFITFTTRDAIDPDRLALILRPRTSDVLAEFQTLYGSRWVWTTFSRDQVDLNFKNPDVLVDIVEVMLNYVRRGADLLRLDAITYLWCELGTSCAHLDETHEIVKLFRDVLDAVAPHVALVTETNVPHADNITYFGDGSDEAQMVYNFALPPLVLHAFFNRDASTLTSWARELEPPSETTAFFNFLDSHDGIGVMGARGILPEEEILAMCRRVEAHGGFVSNRTDADGGTSPYELNITWWSALNDDGADEGLELQLDRFLASRAIALVLRGVPGIYLPSFFGSKNDLDAVCREESYRSINRSAFDESRLEEAFRDPESLPSRVRRRFVSLVEQRVAEPAFHPAAPQTVLDLDRRVFALVRRARDGGPTVLCLTNVSPDTVEVIVAAGSGGFRGDQPEDLLGNARMSSDDGGVRVELAPYATVWLKESPCAS